MIILQAAHIYKSYGAVPVLSDVSLTIKDRERVGLVGANGAGKSTLLSILTAEIESDRGQVSKSKETSIGCLSQGGGLESAGSVWDAMLVAFDPLVEQERELQELETSLGSQRVINDRNLYRQVSERYATLAEQFRNAGGYSYRATVSSVLQGLKFVADDYDQDVSTLSGGQKTRLALARLLMQKPDLLVLDEPTNYLDIESTSWLEQFLQSYQGAVLVVSHDRYFLDSLVEVVYELENIKLIKYPGNYSRFLDLKAQRLEQEAREFEKYRSEKARLEDFVRRNIADKATTGRAKSRMKQLARLQPVDQPQAGPRKAIMSFGIQRESGQEVLTVRDLAVGYDGAVVAEKINLDLYRGERVALLGPNGTGKTTLLKTLAGDFKPLGGTIKEGINVWAAYHDQEQENLSGTKRVLEELWDEFPGMDEKDVRGILGWFLFAGEDVFKKVNSLSGGERARLALAKLMCKGANFLILDEPTNHLDVYSKEVLEQALGKYPGTLLFVSHDRYFINKMATRIIELNNSGTTNYEGNYDYYLEKKKPLSISDEPQPATAAKDESQAKTHYLRTKELEREERKRRRRLEELEGLIHKIEGDIAALEQDLYQPEVYSNPRLYREKSTTMDQLKKQLDDCLEEWVEYQEVT